MKRDSLIALKESGRTTKIFVDHDHFYSLNNSSYRAYAAHPLLFNRYATMMPLYEDDSVLGTDDLIESLVMSGWSMADNFVSDRMVKGLRSEIRELEFRKRFDPAAVGRGDNRQLAENIRGDRIAWLERDFSLPNQSRYLNMLEQLRHRVNRLLYLGLSDFEAHAAVYEPGSFYSRHKDNFSGSNQRLLTAILYLNHDWKPEHGGELRLYFDEAENADYIDIPPKAGRLVLFMSNRFPHEVLPTTNNRYAITCWFRQRQS